jgi:peptidoglycan/xylan/chitin deacetylase (PgdA/CDA1 family)
MRFYRAPKIARFVFHRGIWKGRDKNSLYLTFDDGPHPEVTPFVLDILTELKIKATFFCLGKNVRLYPELFNRILEEGHAVGNHSMFHENGLKTPTLPYISSIEHAQKLIPSELFRPPYGKITPIQMASIRRKLKLKIVFWSWLSYDYDKNVLPNEIIENASKIKGGDVLVFHDSEKAFPNLKQVLKPILIELIKRNYTFRNDL